MSAYTYLMKRKYIILFVLYFSFIVFLFPIFAEDLKIVRSCRKTLETLSSDLSHLASLDVEPSYFVDGVFKTLGLSSRSIDVSQPHQLFHIPPLDKNDITAIRNELDIRNNTGAVTVHFPKNLFNAEMIRKLKKALIEEPFVATVIRIGNNGLWLDKIFENHLLDHFSKDETIQIQQGLNQYVSLMESMLSQLEERKIELVELQIRTHNHKKQQHFHLGDHRNHFFTATYSIVGSGTWFHTIHQGQHRIAIAREGETLILSEPTRNQTLFPQEPSIGAFHGAPNNIEERLILIGVFGVN